MLRTTTPGENRELHNSQTQGREDQVVESSRQEISYRFSFQEVHTRLSLQCHLNDLLDHQLLGIRLDVVVRVTDPGRDPDDNGGLEMSLKSLCLGRDGVIFIEYDGNIMLWRFHAEHLPDLEGAGCITTVLV